MRGLAKGIVAGRSGLTLFLRSKLALLANQVRLDRVDILRGEDVAEARHAGVGQAAFQHDRSEETVRLRAQSMEIRVRADVGVAPAEMAVEAPGVIQ